MSVQNFLCNFFALLLLFRKKGFIYTSKYFLSQKNSVRCDERKRKVSLEISLKRHKRIFFPYHNCRFFSETRKVISQQKKCKGIENPFLYLYSSFCFFSSTLMDWHCQGYKNCLRKKFLAYDIMTSFCLFVSAFVVI